MFSVEDLLTLTDVVADAWSRGAERDWSAPAGTLEWTCAATADHTYDATLAIGMFLASRRQDDYPDLAEFTVGPDPRPDQFVDAIRVAGRLVAGISSITPPDVEAIIHHNPAKTARREDFPPRAALEMVLTATTLPPDSPSPSNHRPTSAPVSVITPATGGTGRAGCGPACSSRTIRGATC